MTNTELAQQGLRPADETEAGWFVTMIGGRKVWATDAPLPYAGNSTLGFDADDHAPTLILRCRFCPAEIAYYGDADAAVAGSLTLAECEQAVCTCGAFYGEGDTLEVVDEDAQLGTKPPSDVYAEFADLYACEGWGCVDGCEDCRCPFCGAAPHAKMCAELRAVMG